MIDRKYHHPIVVIGTSEFTTALLVHRVRFVCSAAASAFELFEAILTQQDARKADQRVLAHASASGSHAEVVVDDNLGFTKDRTISRLTEMQSLEYQMSFAEKHAPQLKLALQEAAAGGGKPAKP